MDEVSQLTERMDERFDRVEAERKAEFKRVDQRFEQVDKRFDRFEAKVSQRFNQVEATMKEGFARTDKQIGELRIAIKDLHEDNKATNRVMIQGFITLSGAIVAGCAIVAGASAF